jgi:hypothetical protein
MIAQKEFLAAQGSAIALQIQIRGISVQQGMQDGASSIPLQAEVELPDERERI